VLKLEAEAARLLGRQSAAEISSSKMKRLAQKIEALEGKDDALQERHRDTNQVRRTAANELYVTCREFVTCVNRLMSGTAVILDPDEYSEAAFQDDVLNLIQISVRGRILQIGFSATTELLSTEDFRVPYTLSGFVRAFNQELLEQEIIEEQLVFYTIEKDRKLWRFFDPRTYRSGTLDQDYLVSVMEQLI
jgi:hypothetical protein